MKHPRIATWLVAFLLVAVPVAAEPVGGVSLGREPTSPAGWSDETPPTLAERLVHAARRFRGNPRPLGILTGTVLVGALGFGLYTIALAYRRSPQPPRP